MTYTPVFYDWPQDVQPISQLFRAGGVAIDGGMTLGGASVENPEPGGRGELLLGFTQFADPDTNRRAGWMLSRLLNGSIMRVRLWTPSVQLITLADLGLTVVGNDWTSNPTAPITTAAAKGAVTIIIDMTAYGPVMGRGHVLGFASGSYEFAHEAMNVVYAGSIATVTLAPPLRRALTISDVAKFRPSMMVTCSNARDVANKFKWAQTMAMNDANLVESLV